VGPALAAGKSLLLISIDGSERQGAPARRGFSFGFDRGNPRAFIHFLRERQAIGPNQETISIARTWFSVTSLKWK
jgi:hypothetical protein